MDNPLLSVCIPTFNRAQYLSACLDSILVQCKNIKVRDAIEIVISDNNSPDNTRSAVRTYQKKFPHVSIRYVRNKTNIGTKNTMTVATYAKGTYIWFFSDDDLQKRFALQTVLNVLKKNRPDLIMVNLDMCSLDSKKLVDPNLFRINKDYYFLSKKRLFSFLEGRFFLPIDWFLTSYSNMIIKKSIFDENNRRINAVYNKKHHVFPHAALIYYTPQDYSTYVLAKSIALYRTGNRSFGPKKEIEFLEYWYPVLKMHYDTICSMNRKYISYRFRCLMVLKTLVREIRIVLLHVFKYDISFLLMRLFYRR